jgi:hypothetical protein
LILAEISITSSWLDRSAHKLSFTDLRKDFAVVLSQVVISRRCVEELVEELAMRDDSSTDVFKDLCPDTRDQDLTFYLGRPDPRKRLEKTVFEVQYSGAAFDSGKWSFRADQSCLRIFADELRLSLEELGRCA